MKNPPCMKDGQPCEERHPGCHDHCEAFIKWKEERNKEFLFNYEKNNKTTISERSKRVGWRNTKKNSQRPATNRRKY